MVTFKNFVGERGMITYVIALSIVCFGSSHMHATTDSCQKEAFLWCSALKHEKLSHEDKLILLNLTYWSWARSAMILHAQKAVAQYVRDVHALIHTSMSGRMNPARLCSIAGCTSDEWRRTLQTYEHAHHELVEKLKAYRYASATYAQCIEYILKGDHASPAVVRYAQTLREHARDSLRATMKAQALSLNKAIETVSKVFESLRFGSTRSFFEVVLNFADLGVFNAFAKFDKKYLQCNDTVWNTLAKSYALGNIIWDMSETARVEFYNVHHRMLVRALCDDGAACEIAAAFNPDGFIAPERRTQCITVV